MIILGLTGSIGSGKSFAATVFKSKGIPVYDADKEVQKILRNYKVIKQLKIFFPDCFNTYATHCLRQVFFINGFATFFRQEYT